MKQRFVDSSNREYEFRGDNSKEGGQALIYRAREPATGLVVALKIFKRAFATSAQREWDLLEETMAEDVEAHQWLLVPLGRGTWNGRVVLVFPWMDYDLESWASGKSLTRRLDALLLAVEAVTRLHRTARPPAGYRVHRDIKPQNILVHEDQERLHVRLTDLGVGKQGDVVESATNTTVFTTRYAPADQALPVSGHPEESWDVHALAVTVFWALTEDWPKKAQHPALGFNAQGTTLYNLHRKQLAAGMMTGPPLTPAELGQLSALKMMPRHLLVNTGADFGWSAQDEDVLIAGLNRFSALPKHILTAMAVDLLQALEHALDPDPRVRAKQARDLYRGLARLQQALLHHGESIPIKVVPSVVTPNLRDRISNPTWIDDAPSDEDLSEPPSSVSNHEDIEINNLEPADDPESESPIFDHPGPPVPVATDRAESIEPAQAESESDLPSRVPEMHSMAAKPAPIRQKRRFFFGIFITTFLIGLVAVVAFYPSPRTESPTTPVLVPKVAPSPSESVQPQQSPADPSDAPREAPAEHTAPPKAERQPNSNTPPPAPTPSKDAEQHKAGSSPSPVKLYSVGFKGCPMGDVVVEGNGWRLDDVGRTPKQIQLPAGEYTYYARIKTAEGRGRRSSARLTVPTEQDICVNLTDDACHVCSRTQP